MLGRLRRLSRCFIWCTYRPAFGVGVSVYECECVFVIVHGDDEMEYGTVP